MISLFSTTNNLTYVCPLKNNLFPASNTNTFIPQQYTTSTAQHVALADVPATSTTPHSDSISDDIPDVTAMDVPRLTYLMNQMTTSDDAPCDDGDIFTPHLFNFTTIRVTTSYFDTFLCNMHTKSVYSYAVSDGGLTLHSWDLGGTSLHISNVVQM